MRNLHTIAGHQIRVKTINKMTKKWILNGVLLVKPNYRLYNWPTVFL